MASLDVIRQNLAALVQDLSIQDQVWLRADCDRALLIAVFTELNKRVDEVRAQTTALLAEYQKRNADDDKTLRE